MVQPESLSCCYPSADLEGDVTPLADLEGAVDGRCRCGFAWLSWCIEVLKIEKRPSFKIEKRPKQQKIQKRPKQAKERSRCRCRCRYKIQKKEHGS